MYHQTEGSLVF